MGRRKDNPLQQMGVSMMAVHDPRKGQRRQEERMTTVRVATLYRLDLLVVPSTIEPHRASVRTLDGHTIRTGLERAGFEVGDPVSVVLTSQLNSLLRADTDLAALKESL